MEISSHNQRPAASNHNKHTGIDFQFCWYKLNELIKNALRHVDFEKWA